MWFKTVKFLHISACFCFNQRIIYLLKFCPNLVIINPATQKNDGREKGVDEQLKYESFKVLDEKNHQETFKKYEYVDT